MCAVQWNAMHGPVDWQTGGNYRTGASQTAHADDAATSE